MKGFFLTVAVLLLLTACASSFEPYEHVRADEPRPGPGLFSGEDGVFRVHGNETSEVGEKVLEKRENP